MPARHEQIGERAVHEQAMSVLRQSAIAHLDKVKHSLNDPDRMLDPGSHFRFGAVFRPLDLIDNTAVAIAAIGEIAGFGRDHCPLSAVGLITPYPGLRLQATPLRGRGSIAWPRWNHGSNVIPSHGLMAGDRDVLLFSVAISLKRIRQRPNLELYSMAMVSNTKERGQIRRRRRVQPRRGVRRYRLYDEPTPLHLITARRHLLAA